MILVLALIQSLLLSAGQVLLKFGLGRMAPFGWNTEFFVSALWNWQFAASGLCFGAGSLLWMYIVKHYPLSQSYPLVSLSYVFGLLAANFFFNEQVDIVKWVGVLFVMIGCVLIAR